MSEEPRPASGRPPIPAGPTIRPGEVRPGEVRPGEVRPPAARRLDRPPSDRYAPPPAPPEPSPVRIGSARLVGVAAAIAGALLWLIAGGVFDLGGGLVIVAVVVGWVVGGGVAFGAWRGRPHLSAIRLRWAAAALGLAAWFVGTVAMYLYAEITLPESSLTLAGRLASTPFLDWLAPQFLPLGPVELLIVAVVAWWSVR